MRYPESTPHGGVHIAAGGHSTRMREVMNSMELGPDYPKHLLPTGGPNGETLLGKIVRQALEAPVDGPPIIHANLQNAQPIAEHPDVDPAVRMIINDNYENSLSPFLDNLAATQARTLGSAGDLYADFSWQAVLDAHESGRHPVTFVVGQTAVAEGGAVFDIADSGEVTQFRRTLRTTEADFINIGVYVFDPQREILRALEDLARARNGGVLKEDVIAAELISHRLVGAYVVAGAFNVNTSETYQALLAHTQTQDQVDEKSSAQAAESQVR